MDAVLNELSALAAFVGRNFLRVLPFLLITVPLSVAFKHTGMRDRIRSVINRGPVLAVVLATAVGALSPFCSCSVIPLVAALLGTGVPLAPVMAFWLASPSMDPEILFMSAGIVGWNLALWRLGTTFVLSLGAGLLTMAIERRGFLGGGILRESRVRVPAPARSLGAAATSAVTRRRIDVRTVAIESAQTLGKFALLMVAAFLLEALAVRFVPAELVARILGASSGWAIPLATLVGIPLYTTNISALGIVSGLLQQGMDGGAALAFLIGGAVTTIPAMSAVWGVVRPRVFALYLGFAVLGSLAAGYAFRLVHVITG
jgi:hypothetical protein